MCSVVFNLLACLAFYVGYATANSNGSPVCPEGVAAVGGDHLDFGPGSLSGRAGSSGSLSDGATVFSIDGTTMEPGAPSSFPVATDLTWQVQAFQVAYKGLLVRVQADDGNSFTLTSNSPDIATAAPCDLEVGNVIGVGHNSPVNKDVRTGVMRFDSTGAVTIDITVVYVNGRVPPNNLSIFAYSGYAIDIVANVPVNPPAGAPIAVPVAIPTNAPVVAPAKVSTNAPAIAAPVEAPTNVPVNVPVQVPSTETPSPGSEPPITGSPVAGPIDTAAPSGVTAPGPTETPVPTPSVTVPGPVDTPVPTPGVTAPTGEEPVECNEKGKGKGYKDCEETNQPSVDDDPVDDDYGESKSGMVGNGGANGQDQGGRKSEHGKGGKGRGRARARHRARRQ
jgi:hypothetical protein